MFNDLVIANELTRLETSALGICKLCPHIEMESLVCWVPPKLRLPSNQKMTNFRIQQKMAVFFISGDGGDPTYLFDRKSDEAICVYSIYYWYGKDYCKPGRTTVHAKLSHFGQKEHLSLDRTNCEIQAGI